MRREPTFGMPTQMFLTSNFSGNSISGESGGIVVESFLSRPWRMPVEINKHISWISRQSESGTLQPLFYCCPLEGTAAGLVTLIWWLQRKPCVSFCFLYTRCSIYPSKPHVFPILYFNQRVNSNVDDLRIPKVNTFIKITNTQWVTSKNAF